MTPDLAALVAQARLEELPALAARCREAELLCELRLRSAAPTDGDGHEGEDRNLSADEAARRLNLSRCTLYRMAQRKELPFAVRVGRRLTFSARGLEKWNRQRMGA